MPDDACRHRDLPDLRESGRCQRPGCALSPWHAADAVPPTVRPACCEVQDELVTVALANRIFAQQQPSSPLTLPFFTTAVLQRAATRADIWAQMAHVREQSASFRRKRAELDALLERSRSLLTLSSFKQPSVMKGCRWPTWLALAQHPRASPWE